MSKLDDLKKQAATATRLDQVKKSDAGDTAEKQWRKLAPVMKYLQSHFTELANSLNVLDKSIQVDFKINDSVMLKKLTSRNFKITHPGTDKEKEFIFEFDNTGEHPAYATVQAGSLAAKFKETLNNNQIKFVATALDNIKSVKFEIKPSVRTRYRFKANPGEENISVTISNYYELWSRTNNLQKQDITTELMDELTKHILRESSRYDEMVGNVVSEAERTRIREKLQTQINARVTGADAGTAPAPQTPKKEKNLIEKLFRK